MELDPFFPSLWITTKIFLEEYFITLVLLSTITNGDSHRIRTLQGSPRGRLPQSGIIQISGPFIESFERPLSLPDDDRLPRKNQSMAIDCTFAVRTKIIPAGP
jgi:hypothetical protein